MKTSHFVHQDAIDYAFAYHKMADTLTFCPKSQRLLMLDQMEEGVKTNKALNGRTVGAYLAAIEFLRNKENPDARIGKSLYEMVEVVEHDTYSEEFE